MHEGFLRDHKDLYKFSILRQLALRGEFKISVCWMKTPGDQSREKDTEYLHDRGKWSKCSPTVFTALSKKSLTLNDFQELDIIENANYFVDDYNTGVDFWSAYDQHLRGHESDLIFFDPNTGLGPNYSIDHLPIDRLREYYQNGFSVMTIQFPRQRQAPEPYIWDMFIDTVNELEIITDQAWLFWGKTLKGMTNVFFFLFVRPEHLQEPYTPERALHCIGRDWSRCDIFRKSTKENQHSLIVIGGTEVLLKGIGSYSP